MVHRGVPKLADFGLAARVPAPGKLLEDISGTLHYLAPEVLQRRGAGASDWWSLGLLLLELAAGRVNRREVARLRCRQYAWPAYLSDTLRDLLQGLLNPSPKLRLQKAADVKRHGFFAGQDWETLPQKAGPYTAPDVLRRAR